MTIETIAYIVVALVVINVLGFPLVFLLGRRSKLGMPTPEENIVRLPPDEPEPGEPEPEDQCRNCQFFDLAEGQAVMAQHPHFMQAAAHLPPARIGSIIQYEDCPDCPAGKDQPVLPPGPDTEAYKSCDTCRGSGLKRTGPQPTGMPMKASWEEFGACVCEAAADDEGNGSVVWAEDTCEHFSEKRHLQVVAS